MQNYVTILTLLGLFMAGCGGGGTDPKASNNTNTNSTAPVLTAIGNKTVTVGDTLTFTVSATDPNNLVLVYSSDGSVGSGPNPYTEAGMNASFNVNTHQFSWNTTSVATGDYYVQFSVMNTNAESDSETIRIRLQTTPTQFDTGEQKYNTNCQSCHGTGGVGGSQTLIQCIDRATFEDKINGGSMTSYASSWSTSDKEAVLYYLNNVNPGAC